MLQDQLFFQFSYKTLTQLYARRPQHHHTHTYTNKVLFICVLQKPTIRMIKVSFISYIYVALDHDHWPNRSSCSPCWCTLYIINIL